MANLEKSVKKSIKKIREIFKDLRKNPSKNIFTKKVDFYMVDPETIQKLDYIVKLLESDVVLHENSKKHG